MPEVRRVSWIEPFFDVVFAAAVAQVGRALAASGLVESWTRYLFLQSLLWWTWIGYVHYVTRLDPDEPRARGLTLLQIVAAVFMAANADDGLASVSTAGSVAAYGAMRLLLAMQFSRALDGPSHPALVRTWTRGLVPAAIVWFVSAVLPVPVRYVAWGGAVLLEVRLERAAWRTTLAAPPDPIHLPERFGLFSLILFGDTLSSMMRGIQQQPSWDRLPATIAFGSIGMVCLIWWLYFVRLEAAAPRAVTSERDVRRLMGWTYAHLPLFLGLALSAVLAESAIREGVRATLDARRGVTVLVALTALAAGVAGLAASREPRRPMADADSTGGNGTPTDGV